MSKKLKLVNQLHKLEENKNKIESTLKYVRSNYDQEIAIQKDSSFDDVIGKPKTVGFKYTRKLFVEYLEKEIDDVNKQSRELIEELYNLK